MGFSRRDAFHVLFMHSELQVMKRNGDGSQECENVPHVQIAGTTNQARQGELDFTQCAVSPEEVY